jgi:hypothetical protein
MNAASIVLALGGTCKDSRNRDERCSTYKTRVRQGQASRSDFARINRAALLVLPQLLQRWLPGGCVAGMEYVALNPRRSDRRLGSFRVNMRSGRWADFAIAHARGRDVVSLAAYLADIGQMEAAQRLAVMLGIEGA